MFKKKLGMLVSIAIGSSLLAMPVVSQAAELVIVNHTPMPTTSKINGFICSDVLPVHGTTPANSEDTIPAAMVSGMCPAIAGNCTAVVYEGAHCDNGGYPIASVTLNENNGVIAAQQLSSFAVNAPVGGFKIAIG